MLGVSYAAGVIAALTVPSNVFPVRVWDMLTLPFYWPLQFVAMMRALYSLAKCPHYWVKTPRETLREEDASTASHMQRR